MMAIYDVPAFAARFGQTAAETDLLPVMSFLHSSNVSREEIKAWSAASAEQHGLNSGSIDGPNEVEDHIFVNVFYAPPLNGGRPVFLLNPHMLSVLDMFEQDEAFCIAFHLTAKSASALSWSQMRTEFCGCTDPTRAGLGSLRRDSYEGIINLRLCGERPVCRTNNGFHLSNGPIESLRELCIWFDLAVEDTQVGNFLAGHGFLPGSLLERPYYYFEGERRILAEATNGMDLPELLDLLTSGHAIEVER
jgi:hypothetical protein